MLRLFARGNLEEKCIVSDLRNAGLNVMDLDPDTDEQWEFNALGDHVVCKIDAACVGVIEAPATWHVAEFKTMNERNFNALQKDGCAKSKPEHFAQMQMGMGLSGMTRALYVVVNKNTDEIYIERLQFAKKYFDRMIQRAKEIVFGIDPPERFHGASEAHFICKMCDFRAICYGDSIAERNCRTCAFSQPLEDGGWVCDLHKKELSVAVQEAGCSDWAPRKGMASEAVLSALKEFSGKVQQ